LALLLKRFLCYTFPVMRAYELTFLFKPEENKKQTQKQIEEWIKKAKGKVLKKASWGVRDLSYEIKKHKKALYLYFEAKLPEKAPAELEKKVKLDENILRHLVVAKGEKPKTQNKK